MLLFRKIKSFEKKGKKGVKKLILVKYWSWATSQPTIAPQSVYIKYIYCVFFEVSKTSKWSCPTSNCFSFSKTFAFVL